jgi:hypothetical protein
VFSYQILTTGQVKLELTQEKNTIKKQCGVPFGTRVFFLMKKMNEGYFLTRSSRSFVAKST